VKVTNRLMPELWDPSLMTILIIEDDVILGVLSAHYERDTITIDWVQVSQNTQARGLCKTLIDTLIRKNKQVIEYNLLNAGGEYACMCYVNAFTSHGFGSFYKKIRKGFVKIFSSNKEVFAKFPKNKCLCKHRK
jgi:hypothetical protein